MLAIPGTSTSDIRQQNRVRVLDTLVTAGTSTRQELAASCNLSPASASNMVQDLLNLGLVEESGIQSSGSGRPRVLLKVVDDAAYFIGADIAEAGFSMGLYDLSLKRVDMVDHLDGAIYDSPARAGESLATGIEALRERNESVWPRVRGIGLALPGIVARGANGTRTLFAQSIGWDPVEVSELLAVDGVTVTADNGAKAFARSESKFGVLSKRAHEVLSVVILIGRGVGMGIVDQGRVLTEYAASAGEVGHSKIDVNGPLCSCGARGCLEAFIGSDAIVSSWNDRGGRRFETAAECVDHIFEHSDTDPLASQILDEVADYFSFGLSNVVNLLNPNLCVVGGGVGRRLMDVRRNRIAKKTGELALRYPAQNFEIYGSALDRGATALGGALLAYENFLAELNSMETVGSGG